MDLRVGFLVYDSRSGSTLLAKVITECFSTVFVTPEIGFDGLLKHGNKWISSASHEDIESALYAKDHYLRNLPIERHTVRQLIHTRPEHGWTSKELIIGIIAKAFLAKDGASIALVIIKNGSHIKFWKSLVATFGQDALFIKIVRDPRAVVNSKIKTQRPYSPDEKMGWGGVLLAALRWRQYVMKLFAMQASQAHVACIHYEDLLTHPDAVMQSLAAFLACQSKSSESRKRTYVIPDQEKDVHSLVHANNMQTSRIEAWKSELSVQDTSMIEAVVWKEMRKLGYSPVTNLKLFDRFCWIISMLPSTVWALWTHKRLRLSRRR